MNKQCHKCKKIFDKTLSSVTFTFDRLILDLDGNVTGIKKTRGILCPLCAVTLGLTTNFIINIK